MADLTFAFEDGDKYEFTIDHLLAQRANLFGWQPSLQSRVSMMFVAGVLAYNHRYSLGMAIIRTVHDMESGNNASGTKPAAAFKRPPLTGLWHKHVFDARFMAGNYQAAAPKRQRMKIALDVMQQTEGLPNEERWMELVRQTFIEPFENRVVDRKLTGEWLVYLPRQGKNYYLAFSKHQSGPEGQDFLDRLVAGCAPDFPDLPRWLDEERRNPTQP